MNDFILRVIAELKERLVKTFDDSNWTPTRCWGELDRITASDVDRWCRLGGLTRDQLYDGVALHLAHDYDQRKLPFGFCDVVINDLFGLSVSGEPYGVPELFWEVFEAFDAGEFHRQPDKSDDPETDFTRPMIAEFVTNHPLRN